MSTSKAQERRDRARALSARLAPIERPPPMHPCHWIDGDDTGEEFCRRCALKEIRKRKAADPSIDLHLGGGYTDHDGPPYCSRCGVALEGSLTDYGVQSELEHFASYPSTSLDGYVAWELGCILRPAAEEPRLGDLFDSVCTWVEKLLDAGKVDMPPVRARCRYHRPWPLACRTRATSDRAACPRAPRRCASYRPAPGHLCLVPARRVYLRSLSL